MIHSAEKVISHKVGLINLAEAVQNVSHACKMMGFSETVQNRSLNPSGTKTYVKDDFPEEFLAIQRS